MGGCSTCPTELYCDRKIASIDYWIDWTGGPTIGSPTGNVAVGKTLKELGGSFAWKIGDTSSHQYPASPGSGYGTGSCFDVSGVPNNLLVGQVRSATIQITGIPGDLTLASQVPLENFQNLDGTAIYSRSGSTHTWTIKDLRALYYWQAQLAGPYIYKQCASLISFECIKSLVVPRDAACGGYTEGTTSDCEYSIKNYIVTQPGFVRYPELVASSIGVTVTKTDLSETSAALNVIWEQRSISGAADRIDHQFNGALFWIRSANADQIESLFVPFHQYTPKKQGTSSHATYELYPRWDEWAPLPTASILSTQDVHQCCRTKPLLFEGLAFDSGCATNSTLLPANNCAWCGTTGVYSTASGFGFTPTPTATYTSSGTFRVSPYLVVRINWDEATKCVHGECPGHFNLTAPAADTIVYSLIPDVSNGVAETPDPFTINSSTGVVTVVDRTRLNAEEQEYWGIVVQAKATTTGTVKQQRFLLKVIDYDEFDAGAVINADGLDVIAIGNSPSARTLTGIKAFSQDKDLTNNTISYSLTDDAGGRFAINAVSGVVTATGSGSYTAAEYSLTVLATSADGSTASATFAVKIVAGQLSVYDSNATETPMPENAFTTNITVEATETCTYALTGQGRRMFSIDSTTGVITSTGAFPTDFDQSPTYDIDVTATSTDGLRSITRRFAVVLSNVQDIAWYQNAGSPTIQIPIDASVGDRFVVPYPIGETDSGTPFHTKFPKVTFALAGTQPNPALAAKFTINASTGELVIDSGLGALGYKTPVTKTIAVSVTNTRYAQTGTINVFVTFVSKYSMQSVININAGPVAVAENAANGAGVGLQGKSKAYLAATETRFRLDQVDLHIGGAKIELIANPASTLAETAKYASTNFPDGTFRLVSNASDVDDAGYLFFSHATSGYEECTLVAFTESARFSIDSTMQKVGWLVVSAEEWSQTYDFSITRTGSAGLSGYNKTSTSNSDIAYYEYRFIQAAEITIKLRRKIGVESEEADGFSQLEIQVTAAFTVSYVRIAQPSDPDWQVTSYVTDASGNVMCDFAWSGFECVENPSRQNYPAMDYINRLRSTKGIPSAYYDSISWLTYITQTSSWIAIDDLSELETSVALGNTNIPQHSTGPTQMIAIPTTMGGLGANWCDTHDPEWGVETGDSLAADNLLKYFKTTPTTSATAISVQINGTTI